MAVPDLFAEAVGVGGASGISTSLANDQWIVGQIVGRIVFRVVGSAIGCTVSMFAVHCALGIADEIVALVVIRTDLFWRTGSPVISVAETNPGSCASLAMGAAWIRLKPKIMEITTMEIMHFMFIGYLNIFRGWFAFDL